jgi:hypothetical protein
VITTILDFEEDIAWEKTVLSIAVPMMPLIAAGADLDLRTNTISIGLTAFTNSDSVDELRNSLLPLLFGSAWKILDLAQELALANASIAPKRSTRWTIEEKSQHAKANAGTLPGFNNPEVLRAIGLLYAATRETRHALVHRRIRVDLPSRSLIGHDSSGSQLPPISYEEQLAFVRTAQRIAQAIAEKKLRPRVEADLQNQLVVLVKHHGVTISAVSSTRAPIKVIDNFPSDGRIDVPALLKRARRTFPGAQYVDIELRVGDGRTLAGELESAPQTIVIVDLNAPPTWLSFI